jgi:transcriptional regulator
MRHNPSHEVTDPTVVRDLIAENPWATLVSATQEGIVASHYPVLLDEGPELAVLTHVGRPDEEIHKFGSAEILLIVAGTHGYISPSWYSDQATRVPTWNFSVAHCYGVPQLLDAEDNLRVLTRLVERFERHVQEPALLDQELGERIARGTVGMRLAISRFTCKVKMSREKDPDTQRRVMRALRGPGPYSNPALADDMSRALGAAGESDPPA